MVCQVQHNCIGRWWNRRFAMVKIEELLQEPCLFYVLRISNRCSPSYVYFTIYVIFCARSVPVSYVISLYIIGFHHNYGARLSMRHVGTNAGAPSLSKIQNDSLRIGTYKNESSLVAFIFLSWQALPSIINSG